MFKIKILTPGKCKEKWLEEALFEYEKRLSKDMEILWDFGKLSLEKEKSYICLDPSGKSYDSLTFSKKFFQLLEKGGSRLTFVIGEDTGLSNEILQKADLTLSLSPLTFTHQMTRLILIEQIYRALSIEKGTKYHK